MNVERIRDTMKRKPVKIYGCVACMLFVCINLYAQVAIPAQVKQDSIGSIQVLATTMQKTIALRWSASNANTWQQTNETGFLIERLTIKRNGVALKEPETILLTNSPLKHAPIQVWATKADNDTTAMIVAEALFGEDFSVLPTALASDEDSLLQVSNKQEELEQRFLMSMIASEFNFEVAVLAAWGYVDSTAKDNEEYVYYVSAADEQLSKLVERGNVYAGLQMKKIVPDITTLKADFSDKSVMFQFDISDVKSYYSGYKIERSVDAVHFSPITSVPIMNMTDENIVHYQDILPDNDQVYYYRIYGINSFAEKGPYSKVIQGMGVNQVYTYPSIIDVSYSDNGEVIVEWEFDRQEEKLLQKFELRKADLPDGNYASMEGNISPSNRLIRYVQVQPQSYVKIVAIDKKGNEKVSFPVMVQPVDSFPPAMPVNLKAKIDTMGIVTLTWSPNTEADLLGYRVFRSFTENGELFSLNDVAWKSTTFMDTVDVKNLNRAVYYSIAALDYRYNQSEKTPILKLVKPNLIPPSSPVFNAYKATPSGIELTWANSSSEDVESLLLYKTSMLTQKSELVGEFLPTVDTYIDKQTEFDIVYRYELVAKNSYGVRSKENPSIDVRSLTHQKASIQVSSEIQTQALLIKWDVKAKEPIRSVSIYRQSGTEPLTLWKELQPWQLSCVDEDVRIGTAYGYMVKCVLVSGQTLFSTVHQVNF